MTKSNKFLNAVPNYTNKNQYTPSRDRRKFQNWQRDGLNWRTLAKHPKSL